MEDPKNQLISKPLAAYRLGALSYSLRLWQIIFWDIPDAYQTEDGVPLAVEQLKESLVVLADEMKAGVLTGFRKELGLISRLHRAMFKAWKTGRFRGHHFGSPLVPGERHWMNLRSYADRTLDRTSEVMHWYQLGMAIGKFQLELYCRLDGLKPMM